jgi:parvulin-like peptidyl-prolyl isomerase
VPDPEPAPAKPRPVTPRDDRVVAVVGSEEIRESDIGEFVIRYFRDRANEALTQLIDSILIEREAGSTGISVPATAVTEAVDRELAEQERKVRIRLGADVSYESYLLDRYGVGLAEHRRDLTALMRTRLLRDRVIRFMQLREERVRVRDAVFATSADAARAARSARDGADLHLLAGKTGIGPSAVLPPLARGDFTPVSLGDSAFALGRGEVSEPVAVAGEERTVWHVLKCIERIPAKTGDWDSLRKEIEAGIRDRPVEQWEYARWAQKMRDRYRARVLR